jgi:HEPN domain-containing protein
MNTRTRQWVRKAEADHRTVELIVAEGQSLPDQVCFHCQQSAEKYLKALLEELGQAIPKTHDLDELLVLLLPHHAQLVALSVGLSFLTTFAVAARYPGFNANARKAARAMRWESKVRAACRKLLGIRERRGKSP